MSETPEPPPRLRIAVLTGRWLAEKARRQAAKVGTQQAAVNLRKQGVPLPLALAILAGRLPH